jgi:site-specific recombinase XerD
MKVTDFAVLLNKYFTQFLPNESGSTPLTIDSYRYVFILYLTFLEEEKSIPADKAKISDLKRDTVLQFLDWLESSRGNSISTRNQRLAAINSFVHFLKYEFPEYLDEYQRILAIPVKKAPQREISFVKEDGLQLIISEIDPRKKNGLRDLIIFLLLYSAAVRVSELIGIRVRDLSLSVPYTLLVRGKGQKSRYVPLMPNTIPQIQSYLKVMNYDRPEKLDEYLFLNHMGKPFTRQGINYLIRSYAEKARKKDSSKIPMDMSPHKLRHSAAMGLVDSGVDLIYIRDLLGHVSVKTTEVYAKADAKLKREAIEAASKEIVPPEEAQWDNNTGLKSWLKNFNKSR